MKILCCVILCASLAVNDSIDVIVKRIREKCIYINTHLKEYKKIVKDNVDGNSEGEQIRGYVYKDSVKLIIEESYGESGKQVTEYYYDRNRVVFIYNREYKYSKPIYAPSFNSKDYDLKESRFYFDNNKMIKWIDEKKNNVPGGNQDFIETGRSWIDYSMELIKTIKRNT